MAAPSSPPDPEDGVACRDKRLDGLGETFENDAYIRKYAQKTQALLQWLAPNKVGVVTNKSLKLNCVVLEQVLLAWCPVAPDRKTVPVGAMKEEARVLKKKNRQ